MAEINFDNHTQFFTATILQWKPLLKDNDFKDIIISSLLHLKKAGSIKVYAFVIMPNHIHLIWQIQDGHKNIQLRLLKFTAQQFKLRLKDTGNPLLKAFEVMLKTGNINFGKEIHLVLTYGHHLFLCRSWIISTITHFRKNGIWLNCLKIINIHRLNSIIQVMMSLGY